MESSTENELEIEVFRSGDYGEKGVYTDDDLARVAEGYNPELHEAPVTLDHAQSGPAHGWVAGLKVVGDRLVARLHRLSPLLLGAIRGGAFRKRSVELFRRFRDTGGPYLKAVSFLGAATPRVNGLNDPAFGGEPADFVVYTMEVVDAPPVPVDRDQVRERLVAAGAWNPRWEEEGLFELFACLPRKEERDRLLALLAIGPAPVAPGAQERLAGDEDVAATPFSATLRGVEEPASAEAHLRALALMAENPELDYRSALIGSNA